MARAQGALGCCVDEIKSPSLISENAPNIARLRSAHSLSSPSSLHLHPTYAYLAFTILHQSRHQGPPLPLGPGYKPQKAGLSLVTPDHDRLQIKASPVPPLAHTTPASQLTHSLASAKWKILHFKN